MFELITSEEADKMQMLACGLFVFLRDHHVFESRQKDNIMLDYLESFIDKIDDFI